MRALAVAAPKRMEDLPDVPTMKEAGADVDAVLWSGIFVPKAYAACDRQEARRRIDADREVARRRSPRLKPLGIEPVGNSSEEFAAILASDIARWTEVAKAANIKIEQ